MAEIPEMVLRVAKAMAASAGFDWERCAQNQWCRDAAAGIAAMHEPTAHMTLVAADANPATDDTSKTSYAIAVHDVAEIWYAMISAALAEQGEP